MTRSRDIAEILGLTEAENTTNASLGDGSGGGSGVTAYSHDSAGALLAADSSGYTDGSLHYLSKLREMYVWDDSDGAFYKFDHLDSDHLGYTPGPEWTPMGSTSLYATGVSGPGYNNSHTIQKWPFAGGASYATDAAELTIYRTQHTAFSSSDYGYCATGFNPNGPAAEAKRRVERFPFASDANATDIGDFSDQIYSSSNGCLQNATFGYVAGGHDFYKNIKKFAFGSSVSVIQVGELAGSGKDLYHDQSAQSSSAHGYVSGGYAYGGGYSWHRYNNIEKFPFSTDTNSTDVGDITITRSHVVGNSSSTHGYIHGGEAPTGKSNVIDKFPFASDGNATDVGDLIVAQSRGGASNYTTAGYRIGGYGGTPYHAYKNVIQSFSFSSDGNATDQADLWAGGLYARGHQV
jgi:hypothetical protein